MGLLDTLTSLIGVGILGYFAYTVILPKALELRGALPQLYAPGTQQPVAAPVAPPQLSVAPEEGGGGDEEFEQEEQPTTARRSTPPSAAAPAAAAGPGSIIYDSSKGWTGVKTAASGNPKWSAGAGGVGTLSCGSGHCRIYIDVKNHNARMEGEYMYNGSVDNLSLRLRSRHNEGGSCENRFGGFGVAIYPDGALKFQTESCHNNHENTINSKSTPKQANKWYRFAYSCYDSPDKRSVNFKLDIDGKTVATGKHPSPKPYYMDENLHNQKSYIWIRSNNSGSGTISVRNFKVYNLGKSGSAAMHAQTFDMQNQPYLFNRFYHGRRM